MKSKCQIVARPQGGEGKWGLSYFIFIRLNPKIDKDSKLPLTKFIAFQNVHIRLLALDGLYIVRHDR